MSGFPSAPGAHERESKAIHRPSGDQRGVPVTYGPQECSSRGLEPSLSQTQMALFPERPEVKAILLPSGEKSGPWSPKVEAISSVCDLALPAASSSMRQILMSSSVCV